MVWVSVVDRDALRSIGKITKFVLLVTPHTTYALLSPEEVAFMALSSLPPCFSKVCVWDV